MTFETGLEGLEVLSTEGKVVPMPGSPASLEAKKSLNLLLPSIFDNMDVAVVIANEDREIVMLNSAAEVLFGYAEQELVGQKTRVLYQSEEDYEEQGRKRFNSEVTETSTYITNYKKKSGEHFYGETQGGPIQSKAGLNLFFVGIVKDVTARLSAERTLNRLHSITSSQGTSFEERVVDVLKLGCEHFGLPIGIFCEIVNDVYTVKQVVHPRNGLSEGMTFNLRDTYCSHVFEADDVQGFHHVSKSRISHHSCYRHFAMEAYLGAPVVVSGERYGVLSFYSESPTRPFIGQDIELIRLFADWVGMEISRQQSMESLKKAHKALEDLANTDDLTGLWNRRMMKEALKKEFSKSKRHQEELSIAVIDFDHFKVINDQFGHDVGDKALQAFAKLAGSESRDEDMFARWGGEEFIAAFPCTDQEAASEVVSRIANKLKNRALIRKAESPTLTISVGIAQRRGEESVDEVIARADKAMYQAKNNGRDQIILAK